MSELLQTEETDVQRIAGMLIWGAWTERDTREGRRMMRVATLSGAGAKAFWDSWRECRSQWYEAGYSVAKWGQIWQLTQWTDSEGKIAESSKRRAAEVRVEETQQHLPADWDPDDVELVSPQAAMLLDYQIAAAKRLKRALLGMPAPVGFPDPGKLTGNALDASDTGTGKTFVSLAVCAELGLRPCVIAPLAVLPSWQRAAKFLGVPLGWLINYDKIRSGRSELGKWKPAADVTKNPHARGDMFVFEYLPGEKPILIFDESQKCKSPDSKQGKILRDAARQGHKILCLSATAAKDPTEMRNLGCALGLHDGSRQGFQAFCQAHGCYTNSYGLAFDWKARKHLERLHRNIFPMRGQRIRIADVPTFPETIIQADALDTGNTQTIKAAYEEMEEKLAEIEASDRSGSSKAAEGLAAIMAARKIAEFSKLDLFQELTETGVEEGESVVVFLNFRDHITELAEKLKTKCIVWGGQKPEERQQFIDDFQADKERVIIISLQAGGAGLSLHDLNGNHPRLAIISPSFSCCDLKQALGRVHRAGAKTKSRQLIVFAANTIEEEICESMRKKLSGIELLNDGDLEPKGVAERLKKVQLTGETEKLI